MTAKITVYIGNGSILDGGPFRHDAVIDYDHESVTVAAPDGEPGTVQRHHVTELADEMNSGQPGHIKAVAKSEGFMNVRIECHDGLLFESDGMVASGEELRSSGDLRRQMSRAFRNHGGEVSENY